MYPRLSARRISKKWRKAACRPGSCESTRQQFIPNVRYRWLLASLMCMCCVQSYHKQGPYYAVWLHLRFWTVWWTATESTNAIWWRWFHADSLTTTSNDSVTYVPQPFQRRFNLWEMNERVNGSQPDSSTIMHCILTTHLFSNLWSSLCQGLSHYEAILSSSCLPIGLPGIFIFLTSLVSHCFLRMRRTVFWLQLTLAAILIVWVHYWLFEWWFWVNVFFSFFYT